MAQTHNTSYLGTLSMPADPPDAKVMIDVDHVTMAFNIASEQLNSLKEYAIALSRCELRFKEFLALDDVSFQVKQGDVFGILGTNGSGKSTILKIIAGVLEPTRGTCTVTGSIAPLIELGAGFDLELTARENIFLNGALLGYSKKFIQEHFEEIVDFAEVRDFLDMPMKNYSSGMVARIAFAIATVIVPDVLIVDEVLSVGDFMFQQKCEQRIQALINEHNVTVLIVSHNNAQIERLCNKAAWIEKGHLRAIGSAKEVCEVYRAIGGRSGSAEAERKILSALPSLRNVSLSRSMSVFGENRYGTAAKLAGTANPSTDVVVLTNSDSARANYIACSLAGLLDGVILTTNESSLPDATIQELTHRHPHSIIAIGHETEISKSLLESIVVDGVKPCILRLENSAEMDGFETYRFGRQKGTWSDTAVILCNPSDAAIVTLSPFTYRWAMPVFYANPEIGFSETQKEALSSFKRCILISDKAGEIKEAICEFAPSLETVLLPNAENTDTNLAINSWIADEAAFAKAPSIHNMVVTALNATIDNYLLGAFAGKTHSNILMVDPQNLDSITGAFESINRAPSIDRLAFIGNELRFGRLDRALLESALQNK